MPKITISNLALQDVEFNFNNESPLTVLAILQENNVDWMHSCGSKGRCTTCRFNIIKGKENFKETTEAENKFIAAEKILPTQRMACQAVPMGNIEIEVPEKCKLPSINYTN